MAFYSVVPIRFVDSFLQDLGTDVKPLKLNSVLKMFLKTFSLYQFFNDKAIGSTNLFLIQSFCFDFLRKFLYCTKICSE